jgi:catechol 1,2-dioxygenase
LGTSLGCSVAAGRSTDGQDAAAQDAGSGDAAGRDGGADGSSDATDISSDAADGANQQCEVTGSDVEGPFFRDDAPQRQVLASEDEPGTRLVIEGTVYGPDCSTPLTGALLDVWHADVDGNYSMDDAEYKLRAQILTDDQGRYAFETIRPGNYPMSGTMRPAHVHFMISKPGYRPLTTQLYFSDDPFLAPDDPCTGCNSGDQTLIIDLENATHNGDQVSRGTFDIVLADS